MSVAISLVQLGNHRVCAAKERELDLHPHHLYRINVDLHYKLLIADC
jgi:hypothetical protein